MIDFFENFRNDFLKKLIKKRTKDKKTDFDASIFFCSSRNKYKNYAFFYQGREFLIFLFGKKKLNFLKGFKELQ